MITFLHKHTTFITAFFAGYMFCYGIISLSQENWLVGGAMLFASILSVIVYSIERTVDGLEEVSRSD